MASPFFLVGPLDRCPFLTRYVKLLDCCWLSGLNFTFESVSRILLALHSSQLNGISVSGGGCLLGDAFLGEEEPLLGDAAFLGEAFLGEDFEALPGEAFRGGEEEALLGEAFLGDDLLVLGEEAFLDLVGEGFEEGDLSDVVFLVDFLFFSVVDFSDLSPGNKTNLYHY